MLALSIIRLVPSIPKTEISSIVVRQLLRSATSIGANYRAALRGKSKADFIMKLKIAEEEADETLYWLEILMEADLVNKEVVNPIYTEANEITAILVTSGMTAKRNNQKKD